jgi:hypothetical protein
METKTKQLADEILLALEHTDKLTLVDSLDQTSQSVNQSETKATFCLSRYIDAPLQGRQKRRGPGGIKPLAMVVYQVTIEATVSSAVADGGEDEDGFLFKGVWITDPALDETLQERVNPWEYYGEAYREYRMKKGLPLAIGRTL